MSNLVCDIGDMVGLKSDALDSSSAATAIADLEGRLVYVNYSFARLWRLGSPEEALGRYTSDFWLDKQGADGVLAYLGSGKGVWTGYLTARRTDGSIFPLLISGSIVYNPIGNPTAIIGTFFDLSTSDRSTLLLEAQRNLGFFLSNTSTIGAALKAVLDTAIFSTEMDSGGIYLVETDGSLRLHAHYGLTDKFLESESYFSSESEAAQIVGRGMPIFSTYGINFLGSESAYAKEGLRAFAGVPIKFENRVIAWLNVASHSKKEWNEDNRLILDHLATTLGGPLSATIRNDEYNAFLGTTMDGFAIVDRNGRYLEVNNALCDLLGYSQDELLKMNITETDALKSEEEIKTHVLELVEKGYARFSTRLKHKSGRILDMDVSVRFSNTRGGVFFTFCRDITDQCEAQRKLELSEARYKAIVDSQEELICRFDADLNLTFVNEAYCRYYGMPKEEMLGQNWLSLVPEHSRDLLERKIKSLNPSDSVAKIELYTPLPDGSLHWQEWSDCALFDSSGKLIEYQSTGRDITQQKKAMEARVESEKGIAAQKALEAQRVQLIRADRLRVLGEMAACIAHELNQPLVGVRGLAEHLLLGIKRGWSIGTEIIAERLQGIVDQADRMSHIIQHIRLFSVQAGKKTNEPSDLNLVVASALELKLNQLQSLGIEVECQLEAIRPIIIANPFTLEGLIFNLLTNARDAIVERAEQSENFQKRIMLCRGSS